jgi:hypothetical protein
MNAGVKMDWRDVVYSCLQAHRDDVRKELDSTLSNSEARFLEEYGVPAVAHGYRKAAMAHCDALEALGPKESYDVIEESPGRLLAQVNCPGETPPDPSSVPMLATRFLLIEGNNGWSIGSIYHPCISCNSVHVRTRAREVGKCFFCDGRGLDIVPEVRLRGFWLFKRCIRVSRPCKYCGGTGKCSKCAGEDLPGWNQVFSVGGLREPAKIKTEE